MTLETNNIKALLNFKTVGYFTLEVKFDTTVYKCTLFYQVLVTENTK